MMSRRNRVPTAYRSSERAKRGLIIANLFILPAYFFSIGIIVEYLSKLESVSRIREQVWLWVVLFVILAIPSLLPFLRHTHFYGLRGRLLLIITSIVGVFVIGIVANRTENYDQLGSGYAAYVGGYILLAVGAITSWLMQTRFWSTLLEFIFSCAIIAVAWRLTETTMVTIAVGILATMLFVDGPIRFWRFQHNRLLKLTAKMRHDRIRRHISPTLPPTHWWNWFRFYFPRRSFVSRPLVQVLFVIGTGFFGIPLFDVWRRHRVHSSQSIWDFDLWEYARLGAFSGFVFAFVYLLIWFIQIRPKHIVYPFKTLGDHTDSLKPLANLITYSFAEQTQRIGELMSLRYVENVNAAADVTLSMVVTSGQHDEFITQMETFGDVELMENVRFRPGRLFAALVSFLAQTQVRGFIQQQQDLSIQVWIEHSIRGEQTVSVRSLIPPQQYYLDVDKLVHQVTMELALKLVSALGKEAHLASSWESLHHFIEGLDATRRLHWWKAILEYRKAIQLEETFRSDIEQGYYHLGAALVFQGELKEGLHYLNIADQHGPALAETQYMLALTLFYLNADVLHKEEQKFKEIEKRCAIALRIRPDFPEAQHLLGTIYHHQAKQLHREYSRYRHKAIKLPKKYSLHIHVWNSIRRRFFPSAFDGKLIMIQGDDNQECLKEIDRHLFESSFRQAIVHLNSAIKQYDRRLRKFRASPSTFSQQYRIMRDRLSATHHLADSLRSLRRYGEAESYYRDVLAGLPGHIRTLADMARVYCLTENWQKAVEFMRMGLFIHQRSFTSYWHPETNISMGWAFAGGVRDERLTDLRLIEDFRNAVAHIDYGLYAIPYRGIDCWEQIDWLTIVKQAALRIKSDINFNSEYDIEAALKDNAQENWDSIAIRLEAQSADQSTSPEPNRLFVIQGLRWLAWRIDSYDLESLDDISSIKMEERNDLVRFIRKKLRCDEVWYPDDQFANFYKHLKSCRRKAGQFLQAVDRRGISGGIVARISRLEIAQETVALWQDTQPVFRKITKRKPNHALTFGERWAVDVYAEITLLTLRFLVESCAYEHALYVSTKATKSLTKWLGTRWRRYWNDNAHFQTDVRTGEQSIYAFSTKVFTYQLASLHAWTAYIKLMMFEDSDSQQRATVAKQIGQSNIGTQWLAEMSWQQLASNVQGHLQAAFDNHLQHPLAIYTKALVYKRGGLLDDAIDHLQHLLDTIAPYDPQEHIANWEFRKRQRIVRETPGVVKNRTMAIDDPPVAEFAFGINDLEILCGPRQFDAATDKSLIHMKLAEIFEDKADWNSCVQHLQLAIVWTPYKDLDADNFLKIAKHLDRLDRLPEAHSMVQEAKRRYGELEGLFWTTFQHFDAQVLECIIRTRREEHNKVKELADKLLTETKLSSLDKTLGAYEAKIIRIAGQFFERLNGGDSRPENLFVDSIPKIREFVLRYATALEIKHTAGKKLLNQPMLKPHKQWLGLACCRINETQMIDLLNKMHRELNTDDQFVWIHACQLVKLLCNEALNRLVQIAEIKNKQAYSRAELRIELKNAEKLSVESIQLLNFLQTCGTDESMKQEFDRHLAYYHDTLGWVYHQLDAPDNSAKDYGKKCQVALSRALELAPEFWHAHYHLARVYQAELESLWQKVHTDDKFIADSAPQIRELLTKVSHHWRYAQQFDTEQRSYHRLARLKQRIDKYRSEWEEYQSPHFQRKSQPRYAGQSKL